MGNNLNMDQGKTTHDPTKVVLIWDFGQTLARNNNSFTSSEVVMKECTLVQEKMQVVFKEKATNPDAPAFFREIVEKADTVGFQALGKRMGEMRLNFKKMKREKTVTENIPMYRMALDALKEGNCYPEVFTEEDDQLTIGAIKEVLKREDIFVLDWDPFPDTIKTLDLLHNRGYKQCIVSNSSNKVMQKAMIRNFGIGKYIPEEAQFVIDEGARKPKPEVLEPVSALFGPGHEMWIIGDMLDRDILCGINYGIGTIFFAQEPMHDDGNLREMPNICPDHSIYFLKQLPAILSHGTPDDRAVVGYYMDAKKLKRQILNDDLFETNDHMVFRYMDPRIHFKHQGKINVFMHKLNETLVYAEKQPKYKEYADNIYDYLDNHKDDIMVIDHPDNLKATLWRGQMAQKMKKAIIEFNKAAPRSVDWRFPLTTSSPVDSNLDARLKDLDGRIQALDMSGIFLVKTDVACIEKNAHDIAVVLNEEGMKEALQLDSFKNDDVIIQEYTPSDGLVYKVYMIGDHIEGFKRQSHAKVDESVNYHMFDSQGEQKGANVAKDNPIVSTDFNHHELSDMMHTIKNSFGLCFFGIDILVHNDGGNKVASIIDINYFPGYREIDNLSEKINSFVESEYRRWVQAKEQSQ